MPQTDNVTVPSTAERAQEASLSLVMEVLALEVQCTNDPSLAEPCVLEQTARIGGVDCVAAQIAAKQFTTWDRVARLFLAIAEMYDSAALEPKELAALGLARTAVAGVFGHRRRTPYAIDAKVEEGLWRTIEALTEHREPDSDVVGASLAMLWAARYALNAAIGSTSSPSAGEVSWWLRHVIHLACDENARIGGSERAAAEQILRIVVGVADEEPGQ